MLDVEKLRIISPNDFAVLGLNHVAYVKSVVVDGKPAYAIHNADGSPIGVSVDRPTAFAAMRQNDIEPVDVH